jgi:hypothetical protein
MTYSGVSVFQIKIMVSHYKEEESIYALVELCCFSYACRLLVMFCIINMLNYVDRGVIASNGVNGSRGSCSGGTCSSGSGIQ